MREKISSKLNLFNTLTEQQMWILCLYTYSGDGLRDAEFSAVAKSERMPLMTLRNYAKTLRELNLLISKYDFYGERILTVAPQHFFLFSFALRNGYPEWESAFEKQLPACLNNPLRLAAQFVLGQGYNPLENNPAPLNPENHGDDMLAKLKIHAKWQRNDYSAYLLPHLSEPEFKPLFTTFEPAKILDLVRTEMMRCLTNDAADVHLFDEYHDFLAEYVHTENPKVSIFERNTVQDMIDAHRFFYDAEPPQWHNNTPTFWKNAVAGIQTLYDGNAKTANKFFADALKISNEDAMEKAVFSHPLLDFYLLAAYFQERTAKGTERIRQLLKKNVFTEKSHFLHTALAKHIALGEPCESFQAQLQQACEESCNPLTQTLFALCAHHFKIKKTMGESILGSYWGRGPNHALLRYEFSNYLKISDKKTLSQKFSTPPLISFFQLKQQWEIAINDVLQWSAQTEETEISEEKESRIAYVIMADGSVEVREQKRMKSGAWSTGNRVNMSDFARCAITSMEEADRRVANCYRPSIGILTLRETLPFLADSNRVFFDGHDGLESVTIDAEKPVILLEKSALGYEVTTNLPTRCHGEHGDLFAVKKLNDNHFAVYSPTEFERKTIGRLTQLHYFPSAAQTEVTEFLKKISPQIEIHSDLLEGGSSLTIREGSNILIIKIIPIDKGYSISTQAQPLAEGRTRLFPGEGREIVFDEANGERYQVHRNMDAELQNLTDLSEFCEKELGTYLDHGCATLELGDLLYMLEFVKDKQEQFALEWPEGKKLKLTAVLQPSSVQFGLKAKENWFEVEGNVQIDENQAMKSAEFLGLMEKGIVNKRFIRLNETDYVAMSESISKYMKRLESLVQQDHNKAKVSFCQIGALAEIVQSSKKAVKGDNALKALEKKVEDATKLEIPIPTALQAELRDYQEEGFRWMARLAYWGAGACLADDMGLGKTIQTITFMLREAENGPAMVVCPSSVVFNWANELHRFAPTLKVKILNESDERAALLSELQPYDVVLSTYGLLVRERDTITQIPWNLVCLDEAHIIKNRNTKMSQVAMKLNASHRIILTGTPLQNNLAELWNLFQFLNPGLLGSYDHFVKKYILPIEQSHNKERQIQLRRMITPFLLRRTKRDVVEELPEKEEITRYVEFSKEELTTYETMRISAQKIINGEKKMSINALAQITKLREAACSLKLVNTEWSARSSKMAEFKTLTESIIAGGNRVLVFSQFTSFLTEAKKVVSEIIPEKECIYLDGSVSMQQRATLVHDFQNGKGKVFLISLKAGGVGLNLTGANYVIHLDPWWNPAIEQQATDRTYRIGQEQNVTVYHLITKNSIEEKIIRLHKTKRDLADALLSDIDVTRSMSLDDLKFLVETNKI